MRKETIGDCELYLGDCRNILPTLGKVDVVVTDPPYGIDGSSGTINKARDKGNYLANFDDNSTYIQTIIVPVVVELITKCKSVILTPGNRNFIFYPQPQSFGCFYQPAAVGLQTFGNSDAQPILYYGKNATGKNMGVPCSYQLTEAPEKLGHPCAKPLKAWSRLVSNNTLPSQTILDPFMGSGTTGVACVQLDRKFIGIELEPKYFDIACKRIEKAYQQPKLFNLEQEEKLQQAQF
jgi:site-specific DNA-methyltransferase (adenine-specific)